MHRLSTRLPRSLPCLSRLSPRSPLPNWLQLQTPYPALRAPASLSTSTGCCSWRRLASTYSRKLSSAVHPRDAGRTSQRFKLADIGEGIKEVEIVKWHIEEGQEMQEFDPIVEVMSDKATVEITSPYSGRVGKLCGDVGTIAQVGGVLCEIEVEGEEGGAGEAEESKAVRPGTSDAVNEAYRASAPPPVHGVTPATPPPPAPPSTSSTPPDDSHVVASPATRRVAREQAVNLTDILTAGTGKGGRLLPEDVLAFVKSLAASPPASASTTPSAPTVAAVPGQPIPLSPLRRAMFKAMTASLAIPHFAYSDTLDVTALSRLRVELNKSIPLRYRATLSPAEERVIARQQQWGGAGLGRVPESQRFDKLTLMPLLVKALSLAVAENPLFLCSLAGGGVDGGEPHLVPRGQHDISVALASPSAHGGLFTPVLSGVDALSTFDVAARLTELQAAAAATATSGGVPAFPKAAQGRATLTLSNIGATGGRGTHPVIPPTGQLAIGAMGRVRVEAGYRPEDEARARRVALGEEEEGGGGGGLQTEPRLRMDVSFCADHRVVEGVELARLVETWKRLVERPERLVGVAR